MNDNQQLVFNIIWISIVSIAFIWLFIRSVRRSDNRLKLIIKWVLSGLVILFVFEEVVPGFQGDDVSDMLDALMMILLCGGVLAVIWRNSITESLAKPFANVFDGGNEPPVPKPYYSVALTKRKLNQPLVAIAEVRAQLARFPNDFEGVMLLAGIQAEDLKDLPAAELTLEDFCNSSGAPPKQVAAAMNQLADWHLKLAQSAEAARAALEKIIAWFPDTELSLQAAQRIAHLGNTGKTFLAAHGGEPTAVPEGVKNIGLLQSSGFLRPGEMEPGRLAAAYVKHLEQHPLDAEIREKLAIIYADHYQRLDLATGELKQLIEYPNQPARRVAHWLNLLADLQVRHGADYDMVRETLEKVVERFSNAAAGELARARLAHLKLELKGQKETPGVKLGVYEQNLGLKPGSLRREL
jgi:tetratricopeptide (TPR) repeat protein